MITASYNAATPNEVTVEWPGHEPLRGQVIAGSPGEGWFTLAVPEPIGFPKTYNVHLDLQRVMDTLSGKFVASPTLEAIWLADKVRTILLDQSSEEARERAKTLAAVLGEWV